MGERPSCVEHLLCVCGRGLLSVAQWPGGPLNITSCHLGSQTQGGGSNVSSSWLLGRQGTITIHTEYVRLKKTPCESEWQLVCFGGPPHPRGRASKVSWQLYWPIIEHVLAERGHKHKKRAKSPTVNTTKIQTFYVPIDSSGNTSFTGYKESGRCSELYFVSSKSSIKCSRSGRKTSATGKNVNRKQAFFTKAKTRKRLGVTLPANHNIKWSERFVKVHYLGQELYTDW